MADGEQALLEVWCLRNKCHLHGLSGVQEMEALRNERAERMKAEKAHREMLKKLKKDTESSKEREDLQVQGLTQYNFDS